MNIFVLDESPVIAAQYHTDKHVSKMCTETAQMLSSVWRMIETSDDVIPEHTYRLTHKNHPCSVWARENTANYMWLYSLFNALSDEYTHRYNKVHLSWRKLGDSFKNPPPSLRVSDKMTPFALAMPDQYKQPNDPVASYRAYYNGEKQRLFSWKNRDIPSWINTTILQTTSN